MKTKKKKVKLEPKFGTKVVQIILPPGFSGAEPRPVSITLPRAPWEQDGKVAA